MLQEKSEFKINVKKLLFELKQKIPNFKTTDIENYVGVKYNNALLWEKSAPPIIDLLVYNSQVNNIDFNNLIKDKIENFPSLKLLKFYNETTGNDILNVIIKK